MRLAICIRDGDRYPRGYGVAWHEMGRDVWVCLPLGLNVIAGGARRLMHAIRRGVGPSALDEAYWRGYEEAMPLVREFRASDRALYRARAEREIRAVEARLQAMPGTLTFYTDSITAFMRHVVDKAGL